MAEEKPHILVEMLEDKRRLLKATKREFAINYLGVTEDTYSDWLNRVPSRMSNKNVASIAELLDSSIEDVKLALKSG